MDAKETFTNKIVEIRNVSFRFLKSACRQAGLPKPNGRWTLESGMWSLANTRLLKLKSQISPNPSLTHPSFAAANYGGQERGAFFSARSAHSKRRIYFLQKKTTVFSLFSKRGKAKHSHEKQNKVSETEICRGEAPDFKNGNGQQSRGYSKKAPAEKFSTDEKKRIMVIK
ncbi:MAG: hypothetical protein ABIE14_00540 [Patescibacteria group bacterium]